jgi:hypothetical protein
MARTALDRPARRRGDPSFNDARVTELLREAKAQGLRPKSDAELLPLLLKLLGAHIPDPGDTIGWQPRRRMAHPLRSAAPVTAP